MDGWIRDQWMMNTTMMTKRVNAKTKSKNRGNGEDENEDEIKKQMHSVHNKLYTPTHAHNGPTHTYINPKTIPIHKQNPKNVPKSQYF
jgi:hypothetical protein